MSLIVGCYVHEASEDALVKGFAWISLSFGVTKAVPSVGLLWGNWSHLCNSCQPLTGFSSS